MSRQGSKRRSMGPANDARAVEPSVFERRKMGRAVQGLLLAAGMTIAMPGAALAGGYDTGERDWDFLFQQQDMAFEAGMRHIHPDRVLTITGGTLGAAGQVREAAPFSVYRASAAMRLGEMTRCMASYRQPFAGEADYGAAWAYSLAVVSQSFTSDDYGLTCSLGFDAGELLGQGQFHLLGGISHQEIRYRLTQNAGPGGFLITDVSDHSLGWRAGLAYEIPEYALRASLIYNSAIDYDMSGTVSLTNAPGVIPVAGSITMPQSAELKFQTGVAPGWLAFGSVKWTDWSVAEQMILFAGPVPASGLVLDFEDSWTVTVGAAHQVNEWLSLAGSLTWDQGATSGFTSQTDTLSLGLDAILDNGQGASLRLGGTIGRMSGGSFSTQFLPGGVVNPFWYSASFGDDLVWSLGVTASVKF